ncbi:MAG: response regulator [Desulfococcaceae bacterium]
MSEDICVLVVDDFSTMRRVIRKILKGIGLENVTEADNGKKAWEIISRQKIDLVICDWHMPNMKGVDLLEKIRSDPKYTDLPFIMVTAEGKKKFVLEASEKGVTSYITKPFSTEDLENALKSMFRNPPFLKTQTEASNPDKG